MTISGNQQKDSLCVTQKAGQWIVQIPDPDQTGRSKFIQGGFKNRDAAQRHYDEDVAPKHGLLTLAKHNAAVVEQVSELQPTGCCKCSSPIQILTFRPLFVFVLFRESRANAKKKKEGTRYGVVSYDERASNYKVNIGTTSKRGPNPQALAFSKGVYANQLQANGNQGSVHLCYLHMLSHASIMLSIPSPPCTVISRPRAFWRFLPFPCPRQLKQHSKLTKFTKHALIPSKSTNISTINMWHRYHVACVVWYHFHSSCFVAALAAWRSSSCGTICFQNVWPQAETQQDQECESSTTQWHYRLCQWETQE